MRRLAHSGLASMPCSAPMKLALTQVLVGNKCDMDESKRKVPYSQGQALADEFGIQFFETSAKNNIKVDEVSAALLVLICQAALTRHCTFQLRS